jgi:hypothetical protein
MHDVRMPRTLGLQSIVFITVPEFALLTTQKDHLLPGYPFSSGAGVQTWRAVTLHFGISYIFVNYGVRQGRAWMSQTTIFWRHEDVLAFCLQVNKDKKRKLIDVFMLLPAEQDLAHQLCVVPIKEIYVSRIEDGETDFPLYVTVEDEVVGGLSMGAANDSVPSSGYRMLPRVFPDHADTDKKTR